jgi:hypothetical protein
MTIIDNSCICLENLFLNLPKLHIHNTNDVVKSSTKILNLIWFQHNGAPCFRGIGEDRKVGANVRWGSIPLSTVSTENILLQC